MLSKLTKLSEEYNVCLFLRSAFVACLIIIPDRHSPYESGAMQVLRHENLVWQLIHHKTADPGATMTFVAGGALKPIGGHILSHASATRLFLRKGLSQTACTN